MVFQVYFQPSRTKYMWWIKPQVNMYSHCISLGTGATWELKYFVNKECKLYWTEFVCMGRQKVQCFISCLCGITCAFSMNLLLTLHLCTQPGSWRRVKVAPFPIRKGKRSQRKSVGEELCVVLDQTSSQAAESISCSTQLLPTWTATPELTDCKALPRNVPYGLVKGRRNV